MSTGQLVTSAAPVAGHRSPVQTGTVCHVVHSLGVGGAEVLVADMIRGLSDRFRSVVACLDDVGSIGESLISDGVPLRLLERAAGVDVSCSRRLRAFARQQSVDMYHVHQCTPMFQAMLSRFPRKRPPLLLTEHGRHHPDLPSRRRALCHRLLLCKADRLVAVGHATREALIANEGLPADRVEVLYNGVDLAPYSEVSPAARGEVRAELQLGPSDLVITIVARLDPIKDHSTAVQTLQIARESVPHAKLLIVGDGVEREPITAEIEQAGLREHVRMPGTRNDVPRLLAASDVLLLSSIGEGIPLTVIEAMASGTPVVSTSVGGVPEMIVDGESGLLAEVGDARALAAHIVRLWTDSGLRKRLTANATKRARELFSRETMLSRYAAIYQEMLHGR